MENKIDLHIAPASKTMDGFLQVPSRLPYHSTGLQEKSSVAVDKHHTWRGDGHIAMNC